MRHEGTVYRVYEELKRHVGRENAISAEELAGKFGIGERKLREYVSEIRTSLELEKIVGSSNQGYFVCTEEEFRTANRRLKRQAISLLRAAHANERKAGRNGQCKMKLGKYYKPFVKSFGE